MAQRKVEFIGNNGDPIHVSPADVVAAWKVVSGIPPQFALGTAQHESSFSLNEVDTEPSGFVSKGVFQLSDEEASEAGLAGADLLDLKQSCAVFANRCDHRLKVIVQAAGIDPLNLPSDVWAYLFLAHNEGPDAAVATIRKHGLDWAGYANRNGHIVKAGFNGPATVSYGNDVISGGPAWAALTALAAQAKE